MKMNLKKLTLEQVREIYVEHLVFDFPEAEVKPFSRIEGMWNEGVYSAYGLYNDEELTGYALFVTPGEEHYVLLDYFAICRNKRCGGYGSLFLDLLAKNMTNSRGIILEVENPDFAEKEEDLGIMERRIVFYEKNGLHQTEITSKLFGVEYRTMILPFDGDNEVNVYEELSRIYHCMFEDAVFKRWVEIRDKK